MRVTITMKPTGYETELLRQDIDAFLHFHAREQCHVSEEGDFDGLTPLIRHHICSS